MVLMSKMLKLFGFVLLGVCFSSLVNAQVSSIPDDATAIDSGTYADILTDDTLTKEHTGSIGVYDSGVVAVEAAEGNTNSSFYILKGDILVGAADRPDQKVVHLI